MANLRKEARGRECQIRIPGVCNGNSETVVLAHYRMPGLCGTGIKSPDIFGAWACSACHDEIDRRTRLTDAEYAKQCHLEGVIRTQAQLLRENKIRT
ncbi:DUF1364 domain-containing protein [Morganella morganii]|uniref:DUF1364 domain-containing protein n=1 Tax=Morganella morganii TaxID=582 RepID=UPI0005FBD4D6|nr:DUF1364 domain-containing protein [Morganella morganii]ELA9088745.1 DUF1364 domain-containing protein [Morganella morganii]MBC3999718.1 DUF1364 domain-containing protein [Morganella morganii]MBT0448530.1 DUF1364 domain-containing protein [Morganella morganii subsp. morganii]MBT0494089.1 DUF1364 domain-containing protein [Morganella morganii subsp. morganii]QWL94413.1 DUF1364 domain-containing protein [Morganella morganii subsp. morganii]